MLNSWSSSRVGRRAGYSPRSTRQLAFIIFAALLWWEEDKMHSWNLISDSGEAKTDSCIVWNFKDNFSLAEWRCILRSFTSSVVFFLLEKSIFWTNSECFLSFSALLSCLVSTRRRSLRLLQICLQSKSRKRIVQVLKATQIDHFNERFRVCIAMHPSPNSFSLVSIATKHICACSAKCILNTALPKVHSYAFFP